MANYIFQFRREVRAQIEVSADSEEDATQKAWAKVAALELSGPDASDDPGELELDETSDEDPDAYDQIKNGDFSRRFQK